MSFAESNVVPAALVKVPCAGRPILAYHQHLKVNIDVVVLIKLFALDGVGLAIDLDLAAIRLYCRSVYGHAGAVASRINADDAVGLTIAVQNLNLLAEQRGVVLRNLGVAVITNASIGAVLAEAVAILYVALTE